MFSLNDYMVQLSKSIQSKQINDRNKVVLFTSNQQTVFLLVTRLCDFLFAELELFVSYLYSQIFKQKHAVFRTKSFANETNINKTKNKQTKTTTKSNKNKKIQNKKISVFCAVFCSTSSECFTILNMLNLCNGLVHL